MLTFTTLYEPWRIAAICLDDRRDLAARPAPRRPEVDDHRQLAAQHLGLPLRGRDRRHELDRIVGHRLVGPLAGEHLGEPLARVAAGPRARPGAPSGTRGTRSGRRAARSVAREIARPLHRDQRIVACRAARAPGRRAAPSSTRAGRSRRGLIASTPAGRTAADRRRGGTGRARARARRPARSRRRSPRTRSKPSCAHCSSRSASSSSSASANCPATSSPPTMSYHEYPGVPGAAIGPRGMHRREDAVGVEVGEQPAEILLVGAVAVHEQQQTLRGGSLHRCS